MGDLRPGVELGVKFWAGHVWKWLDSIQIPSSFCEILCYVCVFADCWKPMASTHLAALGR